MVLLENFGAEPLIVILRWLKLRKIRGIIAMADYPTYDARHSKVPEREPS
jgi:hypothetical protein